MTNPPPDVSGETENDPPPYSPVGNHLHHPGHTNPVIEAANVRARDEDEMQDMLQDVQLSNRIYNPDIEPEHDSFVVCNCKIHRYMSKKMDRLGVQEIWSKAVIYPGEKWYNDCYQTILFSNNPYSRIISPYGPNGARCYGIQAPLSCYYTESLQQTIQLAWSLNVQAQTAVDAREPTYNIWDPIRRESLPINTMTRNKRRQSIKSFMSGSGDPSSRSSMFAGIRKAFSSKSPDLESFTRDAELRTEILDEETGRWPNQEWQDLVLAYQENLGISQAISDLRRDKPIQYLHLLRAGYFEPIPVAWATLASNPLRFTIDAPSGWRGITPAWRGYKDTGEERLFWALNHREGSGGARMKLDSISLQEMASARLASAVEPPAVYYSSNDTCRVQHTSTTEGYSKQALPPPFRSFDLPQQPADNTVILLDVSGSMRLDPVRPKFDQYLITGYVKTQQPKNKDLAKAVIHRFIDAMANRDRSIEGYRLVTFAERSYFRGFITRHNFYDTWDGIRFGGTTRVMPGWQRVKDLHFRDHPHSATYHPIYGWQAGPQTPILRLLLLLDGEASDMSEFELDLLGLAWAHVTIFLIGADGCLHHHGLATELQRISEANHHVSFVDTQGNTAERFVTHELLKRHLGCDLSMAEFEELEQPPSYEE